MQKIPEFKRYILGIVCCASALSLSAETPTVKLPIAKAFKSAPAKKALPIVMMAEDMERLQAASRQAAQSQSVTKPPVSHRVNEPLVIHLEAPVTSTSQKKNNSALFVFQNITAGTESSEPLNALMSFRRSQVEALRQAAIRKNKQ